jgi:hypothetical protein
MAKKSKKKKSKKSNINLQFNAAKAGLNLDYSQNNISKGLLSYALNAVVENFDSNSVQYQNEPGNAFCFDFPKDYKVVGKYYIPERNTGIFFLNNPITGDNEIGKTEDNDCSYTTIINDPCLNFDINRPILGIVHRIEQNGDIELYWSDNNGRRFINLNNIVYLPSGNVLGNNCEIDYSDKIDCNALLLQPKLNIPFTSVIDVRSGGQITSGTYQFTIQYSDAGGNPFTSYYNVTNPIPIADIATATVNFDLPVGKSIIVDVDNLDPTGQYKWFNLAVLKTINGITTPELVGTYFIDSASKQITYTGQNQTNIQLSINEIFESFAFYENADYVTAVQDTLIWKGVTASERINYQKIANKITLQWETWRLPAEEGYSEETNSSNFRGYLRDEVYAFEIAFILNTGKVTDAFHIPGREKSAKEFKEDIKVDSPDYVGDGKTDSPYWAVYNTASVLQTNSLYNPNNKEYKGQYQFGSMGYWESTEEYPCNEDVWGELAGKKIRHHKFPDVNISPIIESSTGANLVMEDVAVFPIGVKINTDQIKIIIENSDLPEIDKNNIVGYKITRGNRGVNKSIIAKGMLRNVGKYSREDQDFIYPNYPFNDLNTDPFISEVNNAWTAQCEKYTVEVNNLPTQGDGNYVEIEYLNCNNNKLATIKFEEVGTFEITSISIPRFLGQGVYNKTNNPVTFYENEIEQAESQWPQYAQKALPSADANIIPKNYDVYRTSWNDFGQPPFGGAAGCGNEWPDYIENEDKRIWLSYEENIIVKVPAGEKPFCSEGSCFRDASNNPKMRDPVLVTEVRDEVDIDGGNLTPIREQEDLLKRQIFNSPETSFGQPFLGDILKLESIMYGGGKGHHVEVKENAKYRLITKEAQEDALKTAESVASITQAFSLEAMFAVYNAQLTIYRNEITKRNFARSYNAIASYNYSVGVPDEQGVKNFNLDIKRYLIPEVLNVGEDDVNLNNFQRETSVFLRSKDTISVPDQSPNMLPTGVVENSRFTIGGSGSCATPEKEKDISVVSYYASLKNLFVNQYGQVYSYESVDTGFVKLFDNPSMVSDVIWGGDTFIGKFAYKTKVPFFFDNRVKFPDDSDIFYDEIGNIGYPKYWHSSRSILETWTGSTQSGLVLDNFLSYKATNFDCPNSQELIPEDADPSTNPNRTFYDGYFYLFAYGIPSFYCESSYNLDLRTAFNEKEGNFWPRVSTGIPDEWVQESNVTILQDNTYNYNDTFSKQNRESVITNLPGDWDPEDEQRYFPFRAIYSDSLESGVNNWLIYRPLSFFDFPQNFGELVALDGLKDRAILARFENKSLLYNNLLTIDTSNPQAAFVGNPRFFENPPIDYAETDQGYVGTQNKMLLKTPYGAVSVDAKRGHVFLINGTNVLDLTRFGSGLQRWFTAHLPFEIIKYYPEVDTDNHFNSVGLHGVFDSNYERVILTKIDYVPLNPNIKYVDGKWEITEGSIKKEIYLIDSDYFCNVSWTISFNFNTKSWISFHSYLPNWYLGENNFFYSGLNYCPNDFDFLVGERDTTVPTISTTTTRRLTTTTSTTIPFVPPSCGFDVTIKESDCTLEGSGVFVDGPPNNCIRPRTVQIFDLISGYQLLSPVADITTSGSEQEACGNIALYQALNNDPNYIPTVLIAEANSLEVGQIVYDESTGNDCTVIPDGWYFTDQSAFFNQTIQILEGVIVSIDTCDVSISTTTTSTTVPSQLYCYMSEIDSGDVLNPLGGVINYIDENGNPQIESGLFSPNTVQILASSIISTFGVEPINCGP